MSKKLRNFFSVSIGILLGFGFIFIFFTLSLLPEFLKDIIENATSYFRNLMSASKIPIHHGIQVFIIIGVTFFFQVFLISFSTSVIIVKFQLSCKRILFSIIMTSSFFYIIVFFLSLNEKPNIGVATSYFGVDTLFFYFKIHFVSIFLFVILFIFFTKSIRNLNHFWR